MTQYYARSRKVCSRPGASRRAAGGRSSASRCSDIWTAKRRDPRAMPGFENTANSRTVSPALDQKSGPLCGAAAYRVGHTVWVAGRQNPSGRARIASKSRSSTTRATGSLCRFRRISVGFCAPCSTSVGLALWFLRVACLAARGGAVFRWIQQAASLTLLFSVSIQRKSCAG